MAQTQKVQGVGAIMKNKPQYGIAIDQHGACDPRYVMSATVPVKLQSEDDAMALFTELESIGYRLKLISRTTPTDSLRHREEQLRSW